MQNRRSAPVIDSIGSRDFGGAASTSSSVGGFHCEGANEVGARKLDGKVWGIEVTAALGVRLIYA